MQVCGPKEISMSDKNFKINVTFAPGCFDSFEGTQEELDEFVEKIKEMAESGELFDNLEDIEEYDEDYDDNDDYEIPPSVNQNRRLH